MYLRRSNPKTQPPLKNNHSLINKIRSIPVAPRVILYICIMGAIGGIVGEANHRVKSRSCLNDDQCWTIEPTQRRQRDIEAGAIAGILAATIISMPNIFIENPKKY
ncbi:MAG: hypothetical protein AAF383_02505 [Cyanobacteria bacterium P01_A01_bin.83]